MAFHLRNEMEGRVKSPHHLLCLVRSQEVSVIKPGFTEILVDVLMNSLALVVG